MITTTRQMFYTMRDLPVETFLLCVDEEGNEYVIDKVVKQKIHNDNDDWYYALSIRKADGECIKR